MAQPDQDRQPPWGTFRPGRFNRSLISLCHRLSNTTLFKQPALWIRHPLKYRHTAPMDIELWGLKLRLYPQGNVSESRMLFTPGLFDRPERLYLKRFLSPGSVFFDIGANAGGYSFWVYSILGDACRILAVEPDPDLQSRIRFNMETNRTRTLELIPLALSDADGTGWFFLNDVNKGENQLIDDTDTASSGAIVVEVRTLLSVIRSNDVKRIDAMKVDIEDHEIRVLGHFFSEAQQRLWPQVIIAEEKKSDNYSRLKRLLTESGYRPDLVAKNNCIYRLHP